uniref:Uncharacterized protein n=1 Tax=Panagrolaimus sp. JU765 TaxID=591449 RepID=A0AC34RA64_9BILA
MENMNHDTKKFDIIDDNFDLDQRLSFKLLNRLGKPKFKPKKIFEPEEALVQVGSLCQKFRKRLVKRNADQMEKSLIAFLCSSIDRT